MARFWATDSEAVAKKVKSSTEMVLRSITLMILQVDPQPESTIARQVLGYRARTHPKHHCGAPPTGGMLKKHYGKAFWRHMISGPTNTNTERRAADRFPIERDVRYRMMSKKSSDENGIGKTVNISSNGVLFTTDKLLIPGRKLEVSIAWPAQLNNSCALRLVARGRIVRFEQGRAAMEIQQYEFRTTGALQ